MKTINLMKTPNENNYDLEEEDVLDDSRYFQVETAPLSLRSGSGRDSNRPSLSAAVMS